MSRSWGSRRTPAGPPPPTSPPPPPRGPARASVPPAGLVEAEASGEDRLRRLLTDLPVQLREAGLLLVVRTLPGSAHAIAAALDRARWPEVVGSIAGDDTVFVAFADRRALRLTKARIQNIAGRG